jgi:hypothetical protein
MIDQFTAKREPQPALGNPSTRKAVIVNLDVDGAAIERTTHQRDINSLHDKIMS